MKVFYDSVKDMVDYSHKNRSLLSPQAETMISIPPGKEEPEIKELKNYHNFFRKPVNLEKLIQKYFLRIFKKS